MSGLVLTPNALAVLTRRYLARDERGTIAETPEELFERVARTVAAVDEEPAGAFDRFLALLGSLEFLPNSPTLMNAGRPLGQLSACFVLPVGDSLAEIFDTLKHAAIIHQSGGGTGFSFSRLRPEGDVVHSTHGVSSGPVSFMAVYDAATDAVRQGSFRRGANMGILRVDHPDVLKFIDCKRDLSRITNFNISVALTDRFLEAEARGEEYELANPRTGRPVGKLDARTVLRRIVRAAWETGEPGVVFLDRVNALDPVAPVLGPIEATNPCGEQPLHAYDSCNLGSIDVSRFVRGREIEWERLGEVVRTAVRFLDNVVEANRYPLPEIERVSRANRKVGLGVMGWADLLVRLEIPYDSEEAVALGGRLMATLQAEAHRASEELARRRGPFPNFFRSRWAAVGRQPLRNATLTTVAPTGTLSILAGCSSGIEPLFALSYVRSVMEGTELLEVNADFERVAREEGWYTESLLQAVAERGGVDGLPQVPARWRRAFRVSHDIAPDWHVRHQAAFQEHTDNGVSKTVNFPESATPDDVERVFRLAHRLGCKGVTLYRDRSRRGQVLSFGARGTEHCPECGGDVILREGCRICTSCGLGRCG
jgi:ribonucleoside-diphosphate reductase alpha chain